MELLNEFSQQVIGRVLERAYVFGLCHFLVLLDNLSLQGIAIILIIVISVPIIRIISVIVIIVKKIVDGRKRLFV